MNISKTFILLSVCIAGGILFSALTYGEVNLGRVLGVSFAMILVGAITTTIVLTIKMIFAGFDKSKFSKKSFGSLFLPITIGAFILVIIGKL